MIPKTASELRRFARRWVPWWRDRLGLRDWHIDCGIIHSADGLEAPHGLVLASSDTDFTERWARLDLRSPAVAPWHSADAEETIVHELLHIHFRSIGVVGGTRYDTRRASRSTAVELVINVLAKALVELRRGPTARSTRPRRRARPAKKRRR